LTFLEHDAGTVDGMRSRVLASALVVTAALAAGCGANSTSPPAPTVPPAPSASPAPQAGRHGIRGTVTAEDGSTWTVTTDAQRDFTVTVTPQTAFGTKKVPGTAQQFPVGTRVRVAGTVNGSAVTAVRIVPAAGGKNAAGATAAPTMPAAVTPAAPAT
jgi:hypothetical protein